MRPPLRATLAALTLTGLAALAPAAAAGPFQLTVPVTGLAATELPAIERILARHVGETVLNVTLEDGVLSFAAGGAGSKQLVRFSAVRAAIEEAGGRVDRDGFHLKAQEIGLALSAEDGLSVDAIDPALRAFGGTKIEPFGALLDGARFVRVVHFDEPVDLAALERHLEGAGLSLDDLVFGHWRYGWKLESGHGHGHDNGAIRRKKSS